MPLAADETNQDCAVQLGPNPNTGWFGPRLDFSQNAQIVCIAQVAQSGITLRGVVFGDLQYIAGIARDCAAIGGVF